jgi:hypothetical protein
MELSFSGNKESCDVMYATLRYHEWMKNEIMRVQIGYFFSYSILSLKRA